jgi:integrase
MRIGEAIALDDQDLDLDRAMLVVRDSKFGKSRLVPLHPTTAAALTRYLELRDELCPRRPSPALFVSGAGDPPAALQYPAHLRRAHQALRDRPPLGLVPAADPRPQACSSQSPACSAGTRPARTWRPCCPGSRLISGQLPGQGPATADHARRPPQPLRRPVNPGLPGLLTTALLALTITLQVVTYGRTCVTVRLVSANKQCCRNEQVLSFAA